MASKRVFVKMKKEPKFSTRRKNRCQLTGRGRSVYRKFGVRGRAGLMSLWLKEMQSR